MEEAGTETGTMWNWDDAAERGASRPAPAGAATQVQYGGIRLVELG